MPCLASRCGTDVPLRILQVQREAIQAVEQDGIVFIDEIDKIVVNQDLRYGKPPCMGYISICAALSHSVDCAIPVCHLVTGI